MSIALTADQLELAEAVAKFAARHAEKSETRKSFESLAKGERPELWNALLAQGLHAIHLPEEVGGQGGGLMELGVVLDEAGRGLIPGPLLPTVIASAIVDAAEAASAASTLTKFADGATGATIFSSGELTARKDGEAWILSGTSVPSIGAMSAELLVVQATHDSGTVWLVVDAAQAGVSRAAVEATDLTRDAGVLTFADARVSSEQELTGLDDWTARALSVSLMAAEAVGLMRWGLETAVDYAKIREQFGKPIGSFQSVKHKCARLLIKTEMAAAAAWDALSGIGQDREQEQLAVSTAAIVALGAVVDAVTDAVTVLGGIGFTWEHDAHMYLRRAITIAGLAGPTATWTPMLGELASTTKRRVHVDLPNEESAFRALVAEKLDQALKLDQGTSGRSNGGGQATSERRTFLANAGLVSSHWPKPWGLGANPTEQIVISEEFKKRDMEQPSTIIGEWAMPTIFAHGTPEQQEKFAMPTLRGEITWCQLFSEPGAGSDLAGLSTKAVKVDEGWQIDGQKVWTSSAQVADWGICLARTDADAPKHRGISYFLVDMRSPGVDVRPLRESTGDAMFNEVFLDGVFVPDAMLVGEPGEGWRLTVTTLANERTSIGDMSSGHNEELGKVIAAGQLSAPSQDGLQALGRIAAYGEAIGALNLRETIKRLNGLNPGAGSSLAKVAGADLNREIATVFVNLLGTQAVLNDSPGGIVLRELAVPTSVIGGGTVEIQLNVVAERVLLLPRS